MTPEQREQEIRAPAVPVETGCAADSLVWRPGIEDLTPEARQALEMIAADERVLPEVAAKVFLRTLVWVEALDCFVREPANG